MTLRGILFNSCKLLIFWLQGGNYFLKKFDLATITERLRVNLGISETDKFWKQLIGLLTVAEMVL